MPETLERCKHGIARLSCALCAAQRTLADMCPVITAEGTRAFFDAVETAMRDLTTSQIQNLYLGSNNGLPVSFNGAWVPFLGFTRGFNHPDTRARIKRNTKVLEQVHRWLVQMNRKIPGRRAFLTDFPVYCDDRVIGFWLWQGEDPAKTVRMIHNQLSCC